MLEIQSSIPSLDKPISKENYLEILSFVDKWEVKGQSYICVAHAYLGALAYSIYTNGWWRDSFHNWRDFCKNVLLRPYPTIAAAYNNYKFYVIDNELTLEEYLQVLSKIGVAASTKLKTRKIENNKETLLNTIEKIQSKEIDLKTLEKEEEKFIFISFRLEKEKYKHIENFLSLVEAQAKVKASSHIGERLHNAVTYLYGIL